MSDILRSRKENELHGKARDAMRANKPEELRVLLSDNKAKKLIRKTGGRVLSYCLIDAIGHRHFECIQELLKAGAYPCNVGECHPVMCTIIHRGDVRVLKLLLDYGANPDPVYHSGNYKPLYYGARFADLGCFMLLLLYGADPDYNCSDRDFLNSDPEAQSVLGTCLAKNYEVPFVKLLIQFGSNMYLPDIQKILIHTDNDAAKLLNNEKVHPRSLMSQCRITIRRLLKQVGKLRLLDQLQIPTNLVRYLQYHNELDYPEKLPRHDEEYFKIPTDFFMLKYRGKEDDNAESRELHLAVQMDKPQHLSELLCQDKYKEYIDSRSGWGVPVTPLRLAASQGFLECVKILLANGAEVDCLDAKAQTPLFAAVSAGHLDCVKELLKTGANPCGSVYNNCSPVLTASRDGQTKILKELLDYGADANIRSKKTPTRISTGCTGPLYLAAVYGHLECFRTLLLYGAEANYNCTDPDTLSRMKNPVSVLELCLKHGCNPEFVKLLIEFGANLYLPNMHAYQSLTHQQSLELLEREKEYPRSLMSQCRLTIRRRLNQMGRLHLIDQLKIPQRIVKYLQHQNYYC